MYCADEYSTVRTVPRSDLGDVFTFVKAVASGILSRNGFFGEGTMRGGDGTPKLTILSLRVLSSKKDPRR